VTEKKSFARENLLVPAASLLFSFAAGALLMLLAGKNPFVIYARLISGTFGSWYGFGQVLFKATTLMLVGLGLAVSFQAGLFNVGGEGQMYVGGFIGALVGAQFSAPNPLQIPLVLAAAFSGGALWAGLAGYLKARFKCHEVITTIMLNFIAFSVTNWLTSGIFSVPETVHTPQVRTMIPRMETFLPFFENSPLNLTFFLALLLLAYFSYWFYRTRAGFELRVMGANSRAAGYAGVAIEKKIITTLLLSGGLCGLASANFVLGYKGYFEQGFTGGAGFMGIAVALLGRNKPLGIFFAALLFGLLNFGGLIINADVPRELVDVIQAVVILSVLAFQEIFK